MIRVVRHADAAAFLARAEPWLLLAEAENNLLIGIAKQLLDSAAGFQPPIYLATVEQGDDVVGCAFRTPPYKLGVTRMPDAVVPLLVDSIAATYDELPAVLGPEAVARAFAEAWCARTRVTHALGMRQRIYEITRVADRASNVPGELRVATAADLPFITTWLDAFTVEAMHGGPPLRDAAPVVARGDYYVWWLDGTPRALVGIAARTPNGARVGPVYTPPGERRRGFASAAVAQVTERQLDRGARFCFLYTDLDNPTSNSIYQRIGYVPVRDDIDCKFE